jgi:hypothetical protein
LERKIKALERAKELVITHKARVKSLTQDIQDLKNGVTPKLLVTPGKICTYCKTQLIQREEELISSYKKRITCGRKCSAKLPLKKDRI